MNGTQKVQVISHMLLLTESNHDNINYPSSSNGLCSESIAHEEGIRDFKGKQLSQNFHRNSIKRFLLTWPSAIQILCKKKTCIRKEFNSHRIFLVHQHRRFIVLEHPKNCFGTPVFSHDVTAAILVSQNNEMAAMLVSQTNPVGIEVSSYANAFFCSNKFA